jgi:hypothetical protein
MTLRDQYPDPNQRFPEYNREAVTCVAIAQGIRELAEKEG